MSDKFLVTVIMEVHAENPCEAEDKYLHQHVIVLLAGGWLVL